MEDLVKELLKDLAFGKSEIETLLDAEKKEERQTILSDWSARYNDVILSKPEVRAKFKDEFELSVGKEATRKSRKSINTDLSLGLTNKQIDELTNEEFSFLVKEHSTKDADKKVLDLDAQYKEEKRLREEAESKLETEIEKVKTEFSNKDVQREIQLRKANLLSKKDSTKFDKTDMELIEYAIEGAKHKQGVSFTIEGDKVFVTKDGQKLRDKANNFVEYETWVDTEVSPRFEIKQKGTPDGTGSAGAGGDGVKEKSEAVKRLEASYKAKGISVEATA